MTLAQTARELALQTYGARHVAYASALNNAALMHKVAARPVAADARAQRGQPSALTLALGPAVLRSGGSCGPGAWVLAAVQESGHPDKAIPLYEQAYSIYVEVSEHDADKADPSC